MKNEQSVKVEQSIKVEPLHLDEKVAAMLREDIYATSKGQLVARQPQAYPDDDDNWAEVKSRNDLLYVAQGLIKVVMDWHTRPGNDNPAQFK